VSRVSCVGTRRFVSFVVCAVFSILTEAAAGLSAAVPSGPAGPGGTGSGDTSSSSAGDTTGTNGDETRDAEDHDAEDHDAHDHESWLEAPHHVEHFTARGLGNSGLVKVQVYEVFPKAPPYIHSSDGAWARCRSVFAWVLCWPSCCSLWVLFAPDCVVNRCVAGKVGPTWNAALWVAEWPLEWAETRAVDLYTTMNDTFDNVQGRADEEIVKACNDIRDTVEPIKDEVNLYRTYFFFACCF